MSPLCSHTQSGRKRTFAFVPQIKFNNMHDRHQHNHFKMNQTCSMAASKWRQHISNAHPSEMHPLHSTSLDFNCNETFMLTMNRQKVD